MECWNSYSNPGSPEYESGVLTYTLRPSDFTVTKGIRPCGKKLLSPLDGFHIVVKGKSAQQLLRKEGVLPLCYKQQSRPQSWLHDGCRRRQRSERFGTDPDV
jgi:hypothetical protein